jgi:DNA invertase Pin-like site-specific DNA recombinase
MRLEWHVVTVFEDAGISSAKGRDKRPGLNAMMRAVVRREIDLVAAWSVDRIGRSLTELLDVLKDCTRKELIFICISRASTPRRPPAARCSSMAFSRNLSAQ